MKHEIKKICKIVDEMTTLLLRDDTDKVDFGINRLPDKTIIKMIDYNTKFTDEDAKGLLECFNVKRQHEIEEYYWQLVGECDNDTELTIIGVMVDESKVELRDGNMYIELVRYKEEC